MTFLCSRLSPSFDRSRVSCQTVRVHLMGITLQSGVSQEKKDEKGLNMDNVRGLVTS
jgi:hypothetical protein